MAVVLVVLAMGGGGARIVMHVVLIVMGVLAVLLGCHRCWLPLCQVVVGGCLAGRIAAAAACAGQPVGPC